jgi:hypothetical protein
VRAAAALALVALAGTAPAHALCVMVQMGPRPMRASWTIAPGGGVVVTMSDVSNEHKSGQDLKLEQPGWRFRDVNTELAPSAIRTIAPGLVVYEVPVSAGPSLDMLDHHKQRIATISRGTLKPLAAPAPSRLVYSSKPLPRGGAYMAVSATLTADPPADALALVMFRDDKAHTPMSWIHAQAVAHPAKTLDVFHTARRCEQVPAFVMPAAGDRVVLAWLDTSGRLSPFSKPYTITK